MTTIDKLPSFSNSAESFDYAPPSLLPNTVSAPFSFDESATTLIRQNNITFNIKMSELLACAAASAAYAINSGFRIPEGGYTGQVLSKTNNSNGQLEWKTISYSVFDIDGGSSSSVYLITQVIDGGNSTE